MRSFLSRAALCALAALMASSTAATCVADPPARSSLRYDPRVLRYDAEKDRFYHATSSVTGIGGGRPGGRLAYYGNRLSAFSFRGPVGQGGIYDALVEDQQRRQLDPANYQYRLRYPASR